MGAKYLTECSLYVTVEPCVMCRSDRLGTIERGGFGATDENAVTRFAADALHPKCVVRSGMMKEECAALMQQFSVKRDKPII